MCISESKSADILKKMPLITLKSVIEKNTLPDTPTDNSLQLLVNRFAHKYDADIRSYIEVNLLRVMSGSIK